MGAAGCRWPALTANRPTRPLPQQPNRCIIELHAAAWSLVLPGFHYYIRMESGGKDQADSPLPPPPALLRSLACGLGLSPPSAPPPPQVVSRVCELKDYTTICMPGPSEVSTIDDHAHLSLIIMMIMIEQSSRCVRSGAARRCKRRTLVSVAVGPELG